LSYSQNSEEQHILKYFEEKEGTFLDIGAYDGIGLSNTRALADKGWKGICLEPSPSIFEKLKENCQQFGHKVLCCNIGIGQKTGKVKFWDNANAVGTCVEIETKRWVDETFTETEVNLVTWEEFYEENPFFFEFISIDTEGLDYDILTQIDLDATGTEMVCIEFNGKEEDKYINYCGDFGMKLIHKNAENLILAK